MFGSEASEGLWFLHAHDEFFLTIPLMSVGVQGKMIQDHAKRNSLTTINSTIQMNLNCLSREPIDRWVFAQAAQVQHFKQLCLQHRHGALERGQLEIRRRPRWGLPLVSRKVSLKLPVLFGKCWCWMVSSWRNEVMQKFDKWNWWPIHFTWPTQSLELKGVGADGLLEKKVGFLAHRADCETAEVRASGQTRTPGILRWEWRLHFCDLQVVVCTACS